MTDTTAPPELSELLNINLSLARLIEPLEMLLAMERAPGIGQRLDGFMAELSAIRIQIERAAGIMETALEQGELQTNREVRQAIMMAEMQRDIAILKAWFLAPIPKVEQDS